MNRIDTNMSGYLHTYEAYRVPKGTKVQDASGKEVVLSAQEDVAVLTEQAGKQLVEDRRTYGDLLFMEAQMASLRTQSEASAKYAEDMAKIMAVYRAMAQGDIVPASDESRLMEYDPELYQAAKTAQMMAQQAERRKLKSQWDEREEQEHRAKMEQLRAESDEAVANLGTGSRAFSEAQKANIVEIDSEGVDFSSMQVMSLGSGVVGAQIDLSL